MKLSKEQIFYKTFFDGYDYISTLIGNIIIPKKLHKYIIGRNYLPTLYDNAEAFIQFCKCDNNYIDSDKYNVGIYRLNDCNNPNNPFHDKEFILFNTQAIEQARMKIDIPNLEFYVCPAYNEHNEVEAIGFRIKNKDLVYNAFKWIFTCGNNIIYGKNTVYKQKPCYVVEGFRDYVALKESGINAIGLGSVEISKQQEEYLNTLSKPIICFDNDSIGMKQTLSYKNKYEVALMTNKEKDPWEAYKKGIKIDFVRVA